MKSVLLVAAFAAVGPNCAEWLSPDAEAVGLRVCIGPLPSACSAAYPIQCTPAGQDCPAHGLLIFQCLEVYDPGDDGYPAEPDRWADPNDINVCKFSTDPGTLATCGHYHRYRNNQCN